MPRTSLSLLFLLPTLLLAGCARKQTRPVILISLDTLRQDHLGCYGYARETSPHLDRFSEQDAVLFEWAYCQAPYTLPSHMSMLTGLYPETHGVMMPYASRPPGKTGGLPETGNTVVVRERQGQQVAVMPTGQLETSRLSPTVTTLAEVFQQNGFNTSAFTDGLLVDSKYGFDQGFDIYRDTSNPEHEKNGFRRYGEELHQWIRDRANEDFFLFIHTYDVHGPFSCPEPFRSRFRDTEPAVALPEVSLEQCSYLNVHEYFNLSQYSDVQEMVDHYDGCIAFVDQELGKLFALLKELDLYDEALIVITSDHGESFMENGLMIGHALCPTNEVTLIPLLLKLPGSAHGGTRIDSVVESVDIMPTMLAAVGLKPPREVQGQNLLSGLERGRFDKEHAFGIVPNTGRNHFLVEGKTKFIEAVNDPGHWLMKLNMVPLSPPGADMPETPYLYVTKEVKCYYDFEQDPLGLLEMFDRGDRAFDLSRSRHERNATPLGDTELLERLKARALDLSASALKAGESFLVAGTSEDGPSDNDLNQLVAMGYVGMSRPKEADPANPLASSRELRLTPPKIDRSLLIQGDAFLWKLSRSLRAGSELPDADELEAGDQEARALFDQFEQLHPELESWVEWRRRHLQDLLERARSRQ
ncbi:MAG: sulfatase [Planctomycetota bacterium]